MEGLHPIFRCGPEIAEVRTPTDFSADLAFKKRAHSFFADLDTAII